MIWYSLTLVCTILPYCTWIFAGYSWVARMSFYMWSKWHAKCTRITSNKFSIRELCHKHKEEPQDFAQHKPYLKILYNAYVFLLKDSIIFQWIIPTQRHYVWSLESRSSPFTTITVSSFIQSAVGILLDSRNAATTSKPNVTHATTILKW